MACNCKYMIIKEHKTTEQFLFLSLPNKMLWTKIILLWMPPVFMYMPSKMDGNWNEEYWKLWRSYGWWGIVFIMIIFFFSRRWGGGGCMAMYEVRWWSVGERGAEYGCHCRGSEGDDSGESWAESERPLLLWKQPWRTLEYHEQQNLHSQHHHHVFPPVHPTGPNCICTFDLHCLSFPLLIPTN